MIIIIVSLLILGLALKLLVGKATIFEIIFVILYICISLTFYLDLGLHHVLQYDLPVVYGGIEEISCYSPFASEHSSALTFILVPFYLSMLIVWIFKKDLSPIMLTLSLIFILLGIIANIFILLQLSVHDIGILKLYNKDHLDVVPLSQFLDIVIGLILIYKATSQEINSSTERRYNNKYLNYLNSYLAKWGRNPFLLLILCLPVLLIITLILILFGQESTSLIKVFTETATWRFSQHSFPNPIPDDGKGHYLCTVAATGDPKLVKPIRLGKRHGKVIVVNRQLLIANAFEELIQDFSPKLHKIIRDNYDKYGYNLSQKISSVFWSNTVYLLMKPLEWMFLITLYLFCTKPEEKINVQYAA